MKGKKKMSCLCPRGNVSQEWNIKWGVLGKIILKVYVFLDSSAPFPCPIVHNIRRVCLHECKIGNCILIAIQVKWIIHSIAKSYPGSGRCPQTHKGGKTQLEGIRKHTWWMISGVKLNVTLFDWNKTIEMWLQGPMLIWWKTTANMSRFIIRQGKFQ